MMLVPQTVTAEQMAKAMRHFSEAAVKLFGKSLMEALTHQWDHNRLRMFLGAQEDALLAAERVRAEERSQPEHFLKADLPSRDDVQER